MLKRAKAAEARAEAAERSLAQTKSEHASDALGFLVAKQRHEQLLHWVGLNKPELLRLEQVVARQNANAAAGLQAPVILNVQPRRRPPKIITPTTQMGNPIIGYEVPTITLNGNAMIHTANKEDVVEG